MEDTHTVIYDFGAVASGGASSPQITTSGGPFSALTKSKHGSNTATSPAGSNFSVANAPNTATGNSSAHISNDAGYFAVFDGHAGKAVADWCGQRLHVLLEEQLRKDPHGSIPEVFDRTFTEADIQLSKQSLKNAGCTAVVALLRWEEMAAMPYSPKSTNGHSPEADSQRSNDPQPNDLNPHHLYRHYHFLHHHRRKSNEQVRVSQPQHTIKERMLYTANAGDARIVLW
jgi:protein phosphatase PTC1